MSNVNISNFPLFKYGEILLLIKNQENLDNYISGLSPEDTQKLRNFLEEELKYLAKLKDDQSYILTKIKSNYEPIANYYYKQDCKEQLEACTNETCYNSNPACFKNKIYRQIEVLRGLLEPFFATE